MEKHFLREKLIADFKALKVKQPEPVKVQKPEPNPPFITRHKQVKGREIKVFLDPEKVANLNNRKSKILPKKVQRQEPTTDLGILAQQYMDARAVGDDTLAEMIFIQIARLDENA